MANHPALVGFKYESGVCTNCTQDIYRHTNPDFNTSTWYHDATFSSICDESDLSINSKKATPVPDAVIEELPW